MNYLTLFVGVCFIYLANMGCENSKNPVANFYNKDIDYFNQENNPDGSLYIGDINTILLDKKNILWIGGILGIVKYNDNQWKLYNSENSQLPNNLLSSLAYAVDVQEIKQNINNDIYAACYFGLRKYNDGVWEKISDGDRDFWELHCIEFDHNAEIVLGTRCYIYRYLSEGWRSVFIGYDDALNIKINSSNNIWASLRHDIISIDVDTFKIYYSFPDTTYQYPNSYTYTDSRITAFDIDSRNHIWASNRYELIRYNGETWLKYNYTNSPLPYLGINGFIIDEQDNIWVYGKGGIFIYNNSTWIHCSSDNYNIPNEITHIYFDSIDRCWFASNSRLYYYEVSYFLK